MAKTRTLDHSRFDYGNFILVGSPAYRLCLLHSVLNAAARLTFRLRLEVPAHRLATVGLQPTGCRRPKASATGEVSRTLQDVQVRRSSTMEDAICSDGEQVGDALGDAEPVQHRQCVGHVIVQP